MRVCGGLADHAVSSPASVAEWNSIPASAGGISGSSGFGLVLADWVQFTDLSVDSGPIREKTGSSDRAFCTVVPCLVTGADDLALVAGRELVVDAGTAAGKVNTGREPVLAEKSFASLSPAWYHNALLIRVAGVV